MEMEISVYRILKTQIQNDFILFFVSESVLSNKYVKKEFAGDGMIFSNSMYTLSHHIIALRRKVKKAWFMIINIIQP